MGILGTVVLFKPQPSCGSRATVFLTFDPEWGLHASRFGRFTPGEFGGPGKQPSIHQCRVSPRTVTNVGVKEKNFAPPRIEPLTSGLPPRSLVTVAKLARSWKGEIAYSIKMDGQPSYLR